MTIGKNNHTIAIVELGWEYKSTAELLHENNKYLSKKEDFVRVSILK
jgi:hypothetical protein